MWPKKIKPMRERDEEKRRIKGGKRERKATEREEKRKQEERERKGMGKNRRQGERRTKKEGAEARLQPFCSSRKAQALRPGS